MKMMVEACGHCCLANITSHETQMKLQTWESDAPFDVVFLDVWEPGDVLEKDGSQKVLTFIDCMMGFAAATTLGKDLSAETMAQKAFASFFVPYGLPRLVVVDTAWQFVALFQKLFLRLLIPVHMVAPENHKAIRNECFHRYLKKVEQINTVDKGSFQQWWQGVMFVLYAWNADPIDRTNIC